MSDQPDVSAVNITAGTVLLDDDQQLQITNYFDQFGDETEDRESATSVVAGPSRAGEWYGVDLSAFEIARRQ